MSATAERGRGPSFRRIVAGLVLLAFFVPAWWAAETGGEGDDWDVPTVSGLPEPALSPGPIPSGRVSSSSGAVQRLLRPPRG